MEKCKCGSKNIIAIEYGYPSSEQYDGISEYQCQDRKLRIGRWSGKELKDGEEEPKFGKTKR